MFLTQIYGTILGGFVNYGVMISIVNGNRELLIDSNGNASWSGATIQSYNTNATSWALAKYLYKTGAEYEMVPIGLAIGAGLVALHRIFVYVSTHFSCYSPSWSYKTLITISIVRSQDPRLRYQKRYQSPPVHPIRWLHPIQPVSNLRYLEPACCWILHAVLSPKLQASHFQGLFVLGHWCL